MIRSLYSFPDLAHIEFLYSIRLYLTSKLKQPASLSAGKSTTATATYPCRHCERVYARNSSLRKHVRRRHDDGDSTTTTAAGAGGAKKLPFVCAVCGKDFLFRNEFVQHEYQHTAERRRHACDLCGRRYASASTLVQHRQTHDGKQQQEGRMAALSLCSLSPPASVCGGGR